MSALVVLSLPSAARAGEVGRAPALCSFDVHDTASPGWLITPTQGKAYATGTMTCTGVVDGKQLTGGPGQFRWWYSYGSSDVLLGGNTCALAGGSGTWEVNLPTVEGPALALTGPFAWMGSSVGKVHGRLGGLPVEMVYEAYTDPDHLDEDCVTKPASHIRAMGQGTVG